ncbi:MAG TPA: hypothetical protein GX731_02540, partial [Clostridiales bacterium]|nr:hypothetical protein [Clostridiales bacterium]
MKSIWNKYIEFYRNNRKKLVFYGLVAIVVVLASIYLVISLSNLFNDSDESMSTDPIDNSVEDDNLLEDDPQEDDIWLDDIIPDENPITDNEQNTDNNQVETDNTVV